MKTRRPQRRRQGLWRRGWQSAFPPKFPRAHRPPHYTRCGLCGLGAPGGGLSAGLLPLRCPPREVTSRCSVGRSSQRPVTHRAHPAAAASKPASAIAGQLQYGVTPERSLSWRSTSTMNSPLTRPEPTESVQRDTQWLSARSGTTVLEVAAPFGTT